MNRLIGIFALGAVIKAMQVGASLAPDLPDMSNWLASLRMLLLCVLCYQLWLGFNEGIELALPGTDFGVGMMELKRQYRQRKREIETADIDDRMKQALLAQLEQWFRVEMRKLTAPKQEDKK